MKPFSLPTSRALWIPQSQRNKPPGIVGVVAGLAIASADNASAIYVHQVENEWRITDNYETTSEYASIIYRGKQWYLRIRETGADKLITYQKAKSFACGWFQRDRTK